MVDAGDGAGGDRVAVLKDGVLQQVDTPRNMYDNPTNVFVAGFIGSPAMNLLKVDVEGNTLHFGGADLPVPRETAAEAGKAGQKVTIGVRPEDMDIAAEGQGLKTTINLVEELGADAYVFCSAQLEEGANDTRLVARTEARHSPAQGDRVTLRVRPDEAHVFDVESGQRLESD